jgi:small subunit ribosomal protein S8
MSMTDPVGDMLTRIRNATMRRRDRVDVPASNLHEALARILVEEGFVQNYRRLDEPGPQGVLRLSLKYGESRESVIAGLRRISKPGRRVYVGREELPRVRNGLGIAIVSTSQGLMTERKCRALGIGGEVLCWVW